MSPADVRDRLDSANFEPFRIVTSDGTTYDVRNRDLVLVGLASIVVGMPSPEDVSLYSSTHLVSLRRVLRLESLPTP